MGRFHPPDHAKGDANTVGGYRAVHARPAAFEGGDGRSYSVETAVAATGERDRPFGGYLLFVRWSAGVPPVLEGHVESDFLVFGASEGEALRGVDALPLSRARRVLNEIVGESAKETGVVLSGTGGVWRVRTPDGRTLDAALRGRLKQGDAQKLAVGDEVILESGERGGAWAIAGIQPRRSRLARRAPGGAPGERILVANVDQVVIVFAIAKPEPHPRMLDRFLVIAEGNELTAHIVINKVDLAGEPAARERFAAYRRLGYPMHFTSVKTGAGVGELRDVLAGRSSVLAGPSGVGKSSLLNPMFPGLGLRVGEISASVNKGRHTTVGALLHPLPGGGFVADTPGLREVGLWNLPAAELDRCFPEMRARRDECRFADCSHHAEPECAVREAVASGEIDPERYESFRTLHEELRAAETSW